MAKRDAEKEYVFEVPCKVYMTVISVSVERAVELLNSQLSLLEEPLAAPGRIDRIDLSTPLEVTQAHVYSVYDKDSGSYLGH